MRCNRAGQCRISSRSRQDLRAGFYGKGVETRQVPIRFHAFGTEEACSGKVTGNLPEGCLDLSKNRRKGEVNAR